MELGQRKYTLGFNFDGVLRGPLVSALLKSRCYCLHAKSRWFRARLQGLSITDATQILSMDLVPLPAFKSIILESRQVATQMSAHATDTAPSLAPTPFQTLESYSYGRQR